MAVVCDRPLAERAVGGAKAPDAPSPSPVRRPSLQGAVVLFDEGLCSVTNFVAGVLVARACVKSQYGLYVLGFSILTMAQLVMRSCVSVPYTVNSPSMREGRREAYFTGSLFQAMLMAVLVAGATAVAGLYFNAAHPGEGIGPVLLALSAIMPCVMIRDFVRSSLLARLRVLASFAIGQVANACTLSILVWMYASETISVSWAYAAIGACSVVAAGAMLLSERRVWRTSPARIIADIADNWRTGRWTLAAVLAGNISMRAMPWLVLLWCGRTEVASFGAMMAIAALAGPVVRGIGTYMAPKLANDCARKGPQAAIDAAKLVVKTVAVVSIAYVAGLFVWGENIVSLVFSESYLGCTGVLTLLAVAAALDAMLTPLRSLLRALRRPHVEFRGTLWGAAAGLGLSVLLIPREGITGAAIGLIGCKLLALSVCLVEALRAGNAGTASTRRLVVEA